LLIARNENLTCNLDLPHSTLNTALSVVATVKIGKKYGVIFTVLLVVVYQTLAGIMKYENI